MEFRLPEIGEGVYEAEFVNWLVKPGDTVKSGQNLMEVMTDKATMEVPAPFAGTITELHASPGQKIKIGDVLLTYTPVGATQPAPEAARPAVSTNDRLSPARTIAQPVAATVASGNGSRAGRVPVRAAPSVRYLARKLGVDLSVVHGSGPDGRILVEDLSAHVQTAAPPARKRAPEPRADFGKPGTRVKMQGLRRKIAERMVQALRTIPHYSYVDECDVSELVRLREGLREHYTRQGVKLTYLAFFVKAVVAALKEVPIVNASLDEAAEEIVLHDRYHVGIAVATPGGLIVPVVHDADRKDIGQIAAEIERLSSAARASKIRLEELRGGTFTITSVGNIGGLFSTPVLNPPEVGILGLGKISKRPVFDAQGKVRAADLVYLSLSFDHRVVDGAVCAAFTNAIIRHLQTPALLLLPSPPAAS
jgi:pyruvate dehydrogenase E2 component (dihydrolipoamide acetyltransferase)/2-oxoisovalerate dehydrogenase E2 component (dihydrolipoyl transacylase)